MTPTTRLILRAVLAATVTAAASLQGNLPGLTLSDGFTAFIAALVAFGSLSGAEYMTPLNPTVGKNVS